MPGLFDSIAPFASGFGGLLGGVGRGMLNTQNSQALQQQGLSPGDAGLLLSNPNAYQAALQQRYMQQTFEALRGRMGDQNAALLAMHPEELGKLTQIQKVGPGEELQAPLNLLGGGNNTNIPQPQQQTTAPQNAGGTDLPAATPGQGGGYGPQGGVGYHGGMNTQGLIPDSALRQLVDRRLKGDVEAGNEVKAGGISGINPLNNKRFQELLSQTMQQRGIGGSDLARLDAKYPAYKDAVKKNADIASQMQLAQSEASTLLPLLKQAGMATNPSNFPLWNKVKQEYLSQTGDPRSAALASYMNAVINTYARGIAPNRGGATVSDKEHLREVASPYWSAGQWDAGERAILNEFGAAHSGITKNQNRIDVQFGFGKDADPADVASAKTAIGRGANKEDVIRRFEEGGFNAPKF